MHTAPVGQQGGIDLSLPSNRLCAVHNAAAVVCSAAVTPLLLLHAAAAQLPLLLYG